MCLLSQTAKAVASTMAIPSHWPLRLSNKAASGTAEGQQFHAALVTQFGKFSAQRAADITQVKTFELAEAQLMEQGDERHQLRQTQQAGSLASLRKCRSQVGSNTRQKSSIRQ